METEYTPGGEAISLPPLDSLSREYSIKLKPGEYPQMFSITDYTGNKSSFRLTHKNIIEVKNDKATCRERKPHEL